jgi:hypothetical protein
VESVEFIGKPSGDCECFCWDVSEEVYIQIMGKEEFEREMKYREESYHHNRMEELGSSPEPLRVYPNDLLRLMGIDHSYEGNVKVSFSAQKHD